MLSDSMNKEIFILPKSLLIIMIVGLVLRISLFSVFHEQPLSIVDEQHYQAIAENILSSGEIALQTGKPTAIRPPIYPIFLSTIYFISGSSNPDVVRGVQMVLSMVLIYLTFVLGTTVSGPKIGVMAAAVMAIYPSYLFFTHLILTEVLFTVFLLLYIIQIIYQFKRSLRPWTMLPVGICLGLAALTRSVMYPFLLIHVALIIVNYRKKLKVAVPAVLWLIMGCAVVIGPWSIRNYKLFGEFVPVGTMGGLNVYMGNYAHTPTNRAWTAVDLTGKKAWYFGHEEELAKMNEAQKQKWAIQKAREFVFSNKGLTLKRMIIKFANFWGLERSVVGAMTHGLWEPFSRNSWWMMITMMSILMSYCMVAIGATYGFIFIFKPLSPTLTFILILILYFSAIHAMAFGHSRYHLPLIPVLALFFSVFISEWRKLLHRENRLRLITATVVVGMLCVSWMREIIIIDGQRILRMMNI